MESIRIAEQGNKQATEEVSHRFAVLFCCLQDDHHGRGAGDLSGFGSAAGYQVYLFWASGDGVHPVAEEPHHHFCPRPDLSEAHWDLLQEGDVRFPAPDHHPVCIHPRVSQSEWERWVPSDRQTGGCVDRQTSSTIISTSPLSSRWSYQAPGCPSRRSPAQDGLCAGGGRGRPQTLHGGAKSSNEGQRIRRMHGHPEQPRGETLHTASCNA